MFIGVLAACSFLCGCDEDVKKDALEKYIYVNKSSLNIFYGDKVQLKANPVGESFEWTSANPAVATVTDGLVEAVGVGSTEITVSQGSSQTLIPVSVSIPTADKVVIAGENGRLQIAVQTLSERVATVRIIWNSERDSIDIPVNNQSGIFTQIINYSGENGYVFQIVSFDSFGNRSTSSEATAMLIRNRDVSSAIAMDGVLTIHWGDNLQYVDHCELSYVSQSEQTVSLKVFPSETSTGIDDYSSDLSLVTLFTLLPSIRDTFRVEAVAPTVVDRLPTDGWVTAASSAQSGSGYGTPEVIFQEGGANVWHSQYSSPVAQLPHWIEIDMLNTKGLTRIEVTRCTDVKRVDAVRVKKLRVKN
jgi:hypothetical protein